MASPNPFVGISPRTPFGASGLGAVGGARGAGAGLLRYLVEFVTLSDTGDLENLQKVVAQIDAEQKANSKELATLEGKRADLATRLGKVRQVEKLGLADIRKNVRDIHQNELEIANIEGKIKDLRASGGKGITKLKDDQKKLRAEIRGSKADIEAIGVLNKKQVNDLVNQNSLKERQAAIEALITDLKREQVRLGRQQAQGDELIGKAQAQRKLFTQRVGGLALGLIGGAIGAAALQPVLQVIDDVISKVTEFFTDVLDPAKKAQEAIEGVAGALDDLVKNRQLTQAQAATELLKQFNIPDTPVNRQSLIEAGDIQNAQKYAEQQRKISDYLLGEAQLRKQVGIQIAFNNAAMKATNELQQQGVAIAGLFYEELKFAHDNGLQPIVDMWAHFLGLPGINEILGINEKTSQDAYSLATATQDAANNTEELARAAQDAQQAFEAVRLDNLKSDIEDATQAAVDSIDSMRNKSIDAANASADASIASIHASADAQVDRIQKTTEARINTLQKRLSHLELIPSVRTKGLEKQLEALKDAGPSRRTNELTKAIERLNEADKRRAYQQSLSDNAEERHEIIIARRLAITNRQININNFQGKDRLTAIKARIDQINREGDAQDKLNQKLDIEYRLNQQLSRQVGETIQDFIERRAQENRDILSQSAEIDRNERVERLQKLADATQYEIDLAQNAADRKDIIRQHAHDQEMERLQNELSRSQDADKAALASKRERLQKELDASKQADQRALEHRREVLQAEIDSVRKNSQEQIDNVKHREQVQVQAVEATRDRIIKAANNAADMAIAARKKQSETILKLLDQNQDQQLLMAMAAARNQGELANISGHMVGFQFTDGQIEAMLKGMGVDQTQINQELARVDWWRQYYQQQLTRVTNQSIAPGPGTWPSPNHAKGWVGELKNSMNFGNNFRTGEQGTEIGMVLSNKVYQALKDRESKVAGPAIGEFNYYGAGNPWNDRYQMERMVEDAIRKVLH